MGFITGLLGDSGASLLTTLFALGMVLVMIVLGVWLLKWVFSASGKSARGGRGPRLAVVETLHLDGRRYLLLVRRDDVEHLVLTGGAHDLLVEQGIQVEEVVAPTRRPLPMVASRRVRPSSPPPAEAAAPTAPPAAAAPPVAPTTPVAAAAPSAIERLRDFGRGGAQPRPVSLRHTGLLKASGKGDIAPAHITDNSAAHPLDSVKEGVGLSSRESAESVGGKSKSDR